MKKLLVILILLVYGTSAIGITVHLHFCCGKLKNIEFTSSKEKTCDSHNGHKMGSKPCCDKKDISIKIEGEQTLNKAVSHTFQPETALPALTQLFVSSPQVAKKILPVAFAPPPADKDRNIFYCIYRI